MDEIVSTEQPVCPRPLAKDWDPPEYYPGFIEENAGGLCSVWVPDFKSTFIVEAESMMEDISRGIRRMISQRKQENMLIPFPSSVLSEQAHTVVMIPTKGWNSVMSEMEVSESE